MPKQRVQMLETFSIKAPVEEVRSFMDDPQGLAECMLGLQSFTVGENRSYDGLLMYKHMGMTARFQAHVQVTEEAPTFLAGHAAGEETKSHAKFDVQGRVELQALDGNSTRVTFKVDGNVEGILAGRGSAWLVRMRSKEIAKHFAAEMAKRVESAGIS